MNSADYTPNQPASKYAIYVFCYNIPENAIYYFVYVMKFVKNISPKVCHVFHDVCIYNPSFYILQNI